MDKFRKLGLIEPIIRVVQEEKFTEPSEVQEKSIPAVVAGKDVIAGSATGSGKTLVFAAGIIKNVERGKGIQALIMTPTRELAEQVSQAIKQFSKYKPLFVISIYGGVSINPQMSELRRADVVVGTPGRLLDHMHRQTINLQNVKILVLDEADRMLDMGFIEDVEKIIKFCPRNRQTLLFSATIAGEVFRLAKRHMKEPIEICAESYVDPSKLIQCYYDVQDNMKFSLLVSLLKNEHPGLIMVFCNTQRITDFVAKNLRKQGIEALAMHGGFSQAKRSKTMDDFHAQNVQVLVCTDVAARGLDIKGVSHIYNYDLPKEAKQYIHRVGRTARAGADGRAINILSQRDHDNFRRILREFHDMTITKEKTPFIERVNVVIERDSDYGREGGHQGHSRAPRQHWGGERRRY